MGFLSYFLGVFFRYLTTTIILHTFPGIILALNCTLPEFTSASVWTVNWPVEFITLEVGFIPDCINTHFCIFMIGSSLAKVFPTIKISLHWFELSPIIIFGSGLVVLHNLHLECAACPAHSRFRHLTLWYLIVLIIWFSNFWISWCLVLFSARLCSSNTNRLLILKRSPIINYSFNSSSNPSLTTNSTPPFFPHYPTVYDSLSLIFQLQFFSITPHSAAALTFTIISADIRSSHASE